MFVALTLAGYNHTNAQMTDFCEAINAIVMDAPNSYTNIRGRMMGSNANATMWSSTIKIPGTIGYRIVNSMGLFYEGALMQSKLREKVKPVYDEYRQKLKNCLEPQGYKLTEQKNFAKGLEDYPKLVFMKEIPENTPTEKLPPHITMEAMYNKDIDKYTVVMFIFQH